MFENNALQHTLWILYNALYIKALPKYGMYMGRMNEIALNNMSSGYFSHAVFCLVWKNASSDAVLESEYSLFYCHRFITSW